MGEDSAEVGAPAARSLDSTPASDPKASLNCLAPCPRLLWVVLWVLVKVVIRLGEAVETQQQDLFVLAGILRVACARPPPGVNAERIVEASIP